MQVLFRVNDELIELTQLTDDEDAEGNLMNDDAYASRILKQSAAEGLIEVNLPITRITRCITESEEILIYDEATDDLETEGNGDLGIFDSDKPSGSGVENCDPNLPLQNKKCHSSDVWKDDETTFMLDQFHDYLHQIGPMKRFKKKRSMWEQIAEDIKEKFSKIYTFTQIENRYKTVVRRKKDAILNNSKTGRSRQEVPFDAELSKIAGIDDSIQPAVIRSAKRVKMLKRSPQVHSDTDSDIETSNNEVIEAPKLQRTKNVVKRHRSSGIAETLRVLSEHREAARKERHKEKMELIREILTKK